MFIGRTNQLKELEKLYNRSNFAFAAVIGQHMMGKTALLREFAKGKKTIFATAVETTEDMELAIFSSYVSSVLTPENRTYKFGSFADLFSAVAKASKDERILMVIDDYPWYAKAGDDLEQVLIDAVQGELADSNVCLLLCGGQLPYMHKHVTSLDSVIGRLIEETIEISHMDYIEAAQFAQTESSLAKAILYGITGGIPVLLNQVTGAENMADDIIFKYLNSESPVFKAPEGMMKGDLRELAYYNRLLMALAQGHMRVNEISAEVGKPKDVVVPYLNSLISLGLVEKVNAITEEGNRKKTRYMITNSMVEFWYRFCAPHMDMIYEGYQEDLYFDYVAPGLDDYMKSTFIKMCAAYLQKECAAGRMPFTINRIGRWWQNAGDNTEACDFDMIALGEGAGAKATIYCTCIFEEEPVELATLKGLIAKTNNLRLDGDVYYVVFSSSKFHENAVTVASTIKNIVLVKLDDMYA